MKKSFVILTVFALLLGLIGCGGSDAEAGSSTAQAAPEGFLVGYGRTDITPYYDPVPLAGYGNTSTRMSNGVGDVLYTTCIAFTDEDGETVLIYHNDLTSTPAGVFDDVKKRICDATGVPEDHIMVSATHTHSAPDLGNTAEPSIPRYRTMLSDWMVEAAVKAMADRRPATLEVASIQTENLNFVRHYIVDDGSTVAENYGVLGTRQYVSHCHDADGQMQLYRFRFADAQDVVLVNWQAHPTRYGKTNNASADFIGPLRTRLENKLDCRMAYFTGAAGNLNPSSRITSEIRTKDNTAMGNMLADYGVDALKEPREVSLGDVAIVSKAYTGPVDKSEDHLIGVATQLRDLWIKTNDNNLCLEEAAKLGLGSQYHAGHIISRNAMADTHTITIHALSLGDAAFIFAPYEMFDQNGVQIKEGSPFDATFVVTLANDGNGYIASQACAEHGCYGFDTRIYPIGTAEILVDEYLSLLEGLYANK